MAFGQILQFSGGNLGMYDAVREELGWDGEQGKPEGLIAHAAGPVDDGFCVVEWWTSESDWNSFFSSAFAARLREGR